MAVSIIVGGAIEGGATEGGAIEGSTIRGSTGLHHLRACHRRQCDRRVHNRWVCNVGCAEAGTRELWRGGRGVVDSNDGGWGRVGCSRVVVDVVGSDRKVIFGDRHERR